ncbi:hypothetical protein ACFE04_005490 [Oxalis oulophora]
MGSDSETENQGSKKRITSLSPIAKPLAGKKLCKRTLKLVRRATENKCVKRGVKEVVKSIRRGKKGLCVIAGNISPIDVITHVPILCEENGIPYIYVPSKDDLASAASSKRPTCCILVQTEPNKGQLDEKVKEKLLSEYKEATAEVSALVAATLF